MHTPLRNLEKMSFADLSDLQKQIVSQMVKRYDAAASEIRQQERALENKAVDLRTKLERMANDLNSHTKQVFGAPVVKVETQQPAKRRTRRGKKANGNGIAIKFRNPDDPSQTWTGRGKAPRWLVALEKRGANRSNFSVTSQAGA